MADHPYSLTCGCPGCQFLWAGLEAFKKLGLPPVIGTFIPRYGDVGRDCDRPNSPYRTWTYEGEWYPYYGVLPRMKGKDEDEDRPRTTPLRPPLLPL